MEAGDEDGEADVSIVSTVVVIEGYDSKGTVRQAIESFEGTSQGGYISLRKVDDDSAGGYKMPECDLWWAAVNHLDSTGLIAHLDAIPHDKYTDVQVVIYTSSPVDSFHTWQRTSDEDWR